MRIGKLALQAVALMVIGMSAAPSQANVIWNWTLTGDGVITGNESGTFATAGTVVGGVLASGSYSLLDFGVTSSTDGFTLGSVSGGTYIIGGGYSTSGPFSLDWDGAAITQLSHGGSQPKASFWDFTDLTQSGGVFPTSNILAFDFALGQGLEFKPARGGNGAAQTITSAAITGTATAVPEPFTMSMFGAGLLGAGMIRARGKQTRQAARAT